MDGIVLCVYECVYGVMTGADVISLELLSLFFEKTSSNRMCKQQILTHIALLILLVMWKNLVNAMAGQGAVAKYEL